jgi:hypothetical protein
MEADLGQGADVDLAARRRQARRTLRRIGLAWCVLVGAAGTIGGIVGMVERENDRT